MRKFRLAVVLLPLSLVLTALISCGDDPDPCDPDCPPTNCGETETECALPETPAAVEVPVGDPALTEFNYALEELEPDDPDSWKFGRSEVGVMHAGCWPEQYTGVPREIMPESVRKILADPWCILDPDVPRPGPSIEDVLEGR